MIIAFVTMFLGLTLGRGTVAVDVAQSVKSVSFVLDGSEVGRMHGRP